MHFYRGSGAAAEGYFVEGHRNAEAYYSEDAAVVVEVDSWAGGGRVGPPVAAQRGDLVRWVEGVDLASGEVKGLIRSGGKEREPLRFVEVAVNNPKSLSVVASQNPAVAAAVDAVLSRQADEVAGYLSTVAVTRVGGRGAQVEVGGLTVETARVRHLTSREGDPHRHIHLMLNTRVRTTDGGWHGLHSVALRQHIRAVNERAHRVLVTDADLRAVLAGEGYTLGADGEIDQARAAVELMSKRTRLVAANRAEAEAEWRAAHPGREPSRRVVNGWDQQAWADGRKAKPEGRETPEELSERVRVELAAAGFDFTPDARQDGRGGGGGVAAGPVVAVGDVDRDAVADDVVAVLSSMRSAWSTAELTAQVETLVAATGVVGDPEAVAGLVADVGARAVSGCRSVLDGADGRVATVMSRHLTSDRVIDADMRLNLGLAGLAGGGGRDIAAAVAAAAGGLDGGQAEAVGAVCGTRRLEVIVGPAGAGKTRTLGFAHGQLAAQGRTVLVVSPTRKGAAVAAAEIGVEGAAVAKLLHEHGWRWDLLGRWTRLEAGQVDPATGRVHAGPGEGWALSPRSVVVVDEAGLLTVDQAVALIDLAAGSGAAIRLVGDPRQLGAVGRGGVMETAVRWAEEGPVVLDQVHRFLAAGVDDTGMPTVAADPGYAELTLALRDGTDPDTVAGELVDAGHVAVHNSADTAVAAIAADVADHIDNTNTSGGGGGASGSSGGGGVAVTVATNDHADRLNTAVRDRRVAAGTVDDTRTVTGMGGTVIGVGDRVVTRRNDTALGVANRDTWTVTHITTDGGITAAPLGSSRHQHVRLDPGYVTGHVQLGYATTDYGNQGVTADRSVTWVDQATTSGGLYVGATRGRYTNTLHLVAGDIDDAKAQLAAAISRDRADRGLDAARTRAAADTLPAPAPVGRLEARRGAAGGLRYAPEDWRTQAELEARLAAVDARIAQTERRWAERPVLTDHQHRQADAADRAAAQAARATAAGHRRQVDRLTASRPQLLDTATADYNAARDDARTIDAGPGRLRRRTGHVDTATRRRDDIARRWGDTGLPGAGWTDPAVHAAAARAVDRALRPDLERHTTEADRHDQAAHGHDLAIERRDLDQRNTRQANRANSQRRHQAHEQLDPARDAAVRALRARSELVAGMNPAEVAALDHARHAHLDETARHAQAERSQLAPRPRQGMPADGQSAAAAQERARQAFVHHQRAAQPASGPDRGIGL